MISHRQPHDGPNPKPIVTKRKLVIQKHGTKTLDSSQRHGRSIQLCRPPTLYRYPPTLPSVPTAHRNNSKLQHRLNNIHGIRRRGRITCPVRIRSAPRITLVTSPLRPICSRREQHWTRTPEPIRDILHQRRTHDPSGHFPERGQRQPTN